MNVCTADRTQATESARLAALRRYLILDTPSDDAFNFLAEMAAAVCEAPVALVTLVDDDRVWVKSAVGLVVTETPRNQACCSWTILSDGLFEVPDTVHDARTATLDMVTGELGIKMYVGASLVTHDGHAIGTLCVLDRRPRQLTERQKYLLSGLARQAMAIIELRSHERMLVDSMVRLEHLAATDDLTGLLNRRALFEKIDLEMTRARRYDTPLSLVLIDIDHFKSVNDHHGHQCGDEVLRAIGQLIGTSKRSVDIAGRYGGEELCVVLPQTTVEGAFAFAEALRQKISKLQFDGPQRNFGVTASMGISATGTTLRDAARMIALADKAMYDAKHAGRNQVVVA